jgi:PIN domain nuclease of toxin-antitoxin system
VRLLLDTHVFIWWQVDDPRLNAAAREGIREAEQAYVSAASAWEIAIKAPLGKITGVPNMAGNLIQYGFHELGVSIAHAERVSALPLHHRNPFDRMLIAQSECEGLTLVTHDRVLEAYGISFLWT